MPPRLVWRNWKRNFADSAASRTFRQLAVSPTVTSSCRADHAPENPPESQCKEIPTFVASPRPGPRPHLLKWFGYRLLLGGPIAPTADHCYYGSSGLCVWLYSCGSVHDTVGLRNRAILTSFKEDATLDRTRWNLHERISEIDERLKSNWYRSAYEESHARIQKLGMQRRLAMDEEERKRAAMFEEDRRRGR